MKADLFLLTLVATALAAPSPSPSASTSPTAAVAPARVPPHLRRSRTHIPHGASRSDADAYAPLVTWRRCEPTPSGTERWACAPLGWLPDPADPEDVPSEADCRAVGMSNERDFTCGGDAYTLFWDTKSMYSAGAHFGFCSLSPEGEIMICGHEY